MARILLVDDEKVARSMYSDFLAGAGHSVTAVGSIPEAKTALANDRFDSVVTDLILPGGDGMEVLQYTKEQHPGVEVIVITALDKVDPAVRAIKSGAAEYLVKPVAPEALAHAVTRALTTRQLLRENADLRRYVALLETGQRVATTLDRDRLFATAVGAFEQHARADAALLYVRQGEQLRLEHAHGLESQVQEEVARALEGQLGGLLADARGRELSLRLPEPYRVALAAPAAENEAVLGMAVLLYREKLPEGAQASADYLARHLGLALHNLGRFAEVEDLAYLDDLTHLFNMRYLDLVLDREVKAAQQAHKSFSLLFLDLDYFKSVNDTHGHLVGSKLLVEVARIIKGCVRDNDVVVRYGGDEYVVLLRGTDSGGALKVGERIRRTIETHHFLSREGYGLSITTCIGVASFPEHAQDKATLLDFADRAMYRGKKGTRNVIYMAAKGLEATPPQRHSAPTS
ncbi:MAG: diguanylate cyclase [Myxococcales bacterium]|nr:diguanylate cyclase [Myxococcales bacterium]